MVVCVPSWATARWTSPRSMPAPPVVPQDKRLDAVGGTQLVLLPVPAQLHLAGQIVGPGDEQGCIALAVGEAQQSVLEADDAGLPDHPVETLAPARRMGQWIAFTALAPTRQRRKEGLYHRIGRVGMQKRRGEPAH